MNKTQEALIYKLENKSARIGVVGTSSGGGFC